jgi:ribosomal protein L11 methyltransferase
MPLFATVIILVMTNYIQVTIAGAVDEKAEMLLAILAEIEYEGFEETKEGLNAFIPEAAFDESALNALAVQWQLSYTTQTVKAQNWNAQWESGFEPVTVNGFAAIRAIFHQPVSGVQHEVIITPKMSFGTGHHATTYMMVEQMAGIDFNGKSVLDFGTGTGVLAILAEKLGAQSILAIDNDDWSINNCKENVDINNCTNINIEKADSLPQLQQFDVILANINLNVITASLSDIAKACKPRSSILLSGFLEEDIAVLRPLLEQWNFQEIGVFSKNNWRCMAAKLN